MVKTQIKNALIMLVISIALVFCIGALTAKEAVNYTDGIYYDTAKGMDEGLWVKIELKDNKIASVEVIENHETVGVCEKAIDTVPGNIVEKNSPYVDAVAGATFTSTGIKNAVIGCLDQAAGKKDAVTYTPPAPKADPVPLNYTYNAGVYRASAMGFEEDIEVEVEFSATAIVKVTILNKEDGEERVKLAKETVPSDIITWQTYDVDAKAGATWTSKGIMDAVKDCVEQAKK